MNKSIEETLAKLREDFKNKLPEKISEINTIWRQLTQQPDSENIKLFHLKTHSLHGSSFTYGYPQIGQAAAELEAIIKSLLDKPELVNQNSEKISELLKKLATLSKQEDNTTPEQNASEDTQLERSIYVYDDDFKWENDLSEQVATFGYKIQKFDEEEIFIKKLQNKIPAILIINIDLVTAKLQDTLLSIIKKFRSSISILFVASSGEFTLRLKSVRLGGEGYFIKPFLIDDLINQIDELLKLKSQISRVLIVDDEIEVAKYYATILAQANMKTSYISKSKDIDRALHESNPDLILIDLLMPECDGVELATIIRQQSTYQSVPIIYLSAEQDQLTQLKAMKFGADDFVTKSTPPEYLILKIKNRIIRYKKLRSLLVTDNLTGLYNHSFIVNQLELELKKSIQSHNPLSVVLIDFDRFRTINDTYGHQAGDHVLKSFGLMLTKRLNAKDIIGRYSNDIFLIILPNTSGEAAKTIIDEIRKHFLTLNYSWNQQIFNTTFSAGIASFPEFHTTPELLEAASRAVDISKKSGRNRVEVAT